MESKMPSEFKHFYFSDWNIGAFYERKVKGEVIKLGRLVSKESRGRVYDKDMYLTFERADGTTYEHYVEFDSSYRLGSL